MTRLIDADKVLKKVETMYVAIDSSLNSALAVNAYDIKHAKTVDAIPVEWIKRWSKEPMTEKDMKMAEQCEWDILDWMIADWHKRKEE